MRKMRMSRSMLAIPVMTLLALVVCTASATGASYPERPVSILCGFSAGAAADLSLRAFVEATKPYLPQAVVVVNRPGGGTTIAQSEAALAAPDGYTLAQGYGPAICMQPHLSSDLPYKGPRDIKPIIDQTTTTVFLAVKADSPWKTIRELVDYAKKNPGKVRIGTAGVGSVGHIVLEGLKAATKADFTMVPFAGSAPSIPALLGGHIEGSIAAAIPFIPHVKAGTMRILLLFDEERDQFWPDVPTTVELGYKMYNVAADYFIWAPKATPDGVTKILYEAFTKAVKSESYKKWLANNATTVKHRTPDVLARDLDTAYTYFGELVKKVKLK